MEENNGSFDVINMLGGGTSKPPQPIDDHSETNDFAGDKGKVDENELRELQQWYLWNCTFEEI